MQSKVYARLACLIDARLRCIETGNLEWQLKHNEAIEKIADDCLPNGSGIDNGCKVDLDRSKTDKIVINFGYHCMNENGYYDGWIDYTCIVTPSLQFGISLRITGRDYHGNKEYLHEVFYHALNEMIER